MGVDRPNRTHHFFLESPPNLLRLSRPGPIWLNGDGTKVKTRHGDDHEIKPMVFWNDPCEISWKDIIDIIWILQWPEISWKSMNSAAMTWNILKRHTIYNDLKYLEKTWTLKRHELWQTAVVIMCSKRRWHTRKKTTIHCKRTSTFLGFLRNSGHKNLRHWRPEYRPPKEQSH